MRYNTTQVKVNGVVKTIKTGDAVLIDGIKYIFQWCTYQFERWIDTSRPSFYSDINVEGGFYNVDDVVLQ